MVTDSVCILQLQDRWGANWLLQVAVSVWAYHRTLMALCALAGSVNDLGLLILLNISIVLFGGVLRHFLVHKDLPGGATPTLGQDLYRVRLSTSAFVVVT